MPNPFFSILTVVSALGVSAAPQSPMAIRELLKPEVYKRVAEEREIQVYARIGEEPGPGQGQPYRFYAAMRVRASVKRAMETLTEYGLYREMVPFVSRSEERQGLLWIEGGIFGWNLASQVRITPVGDRRLEYRIVGGHLMGLSGRVLFEALGDRDALLFFDGGMVGKKWPPAMVMERGAEIVFGLTADRMRSLIEKRERDGVQENAKKSRVQGSGAQIPFQKTHPVQG